MIKNIIFDIGNVIYYLDIEKIINEYTDDEEEREFIYNEIYNSPEWIKNGLIDTGYIDFDTAISLIQDRTNHIRDYIVEDFFPNYPKKGYVEERVVNLINELKEKGYNIYILSNMSKTAIDIIDMKDVLDNINGYVLSYEYHQIKPFLGIYNTLINKYDLDPKECLFIDDREENMRTANLLGIHGKSVKPNDIDSVIDVLKEYKILE